MPAIELTTTIRAPIERCFDLARSIELHIVTAGQTQERAIAGRTSGLIELGETVTWRAKHFGLSLELTVGITAFDAPRYFQDAMRKGPFASMQHDHWFETYGESTIMRDAFIYSSPLGPLGELADRLVLHRYMRRFLAERAHILKVTAESDAWREYLTQ